MTFDTAKLAITQKNDGTLQVAKTTVTWRGAKTFSTNNSPPTCLGVVIPPGRPFSTDICVAGPGIPPQYQKANLTFSGDINAWHSHYTACREVTQLMVVNGVLKELKIQLSCEHSHVAPSLPNVIHAVAGAGAAILQVFHMFFRRLFGTPG